MHNEHPSLRAQAQQIWQAGVQAVKPSSSVPAALQALGPLVDGWRSSWKYLVIGGGKAGAAMGEAVQDFLLDKGIAPNHVKGWLNVPEGAEPKQLTSITIHRARPTGVNFPTTAAVEGTMRMLEMIDQAEDDTLILCLISGGGSALLTAPVAEVPLADKVQVSKQLSAAGASIQQLNAVRKHLSQIKGGGLTRRCFPERAKSTRRLQLISLIISDVIGDPLDVIASGPTAPDPTTFAEAVNILDELGIRQQVPKSIAEYLELGREGKHPETLKSLPREEPELMHRIIANNQLALEHSAEAARTLGYEVINLCDHLEGDTLDLAAFFKTEFAAWSAHRPLCVLSGGETTVRLPATPGKGGRNQSMALALLESMGEHHLQNVCLLCAGTDGEDGPTDAAGAFADEEVWEQAQKLKLNTTDYLRRQDAYSFFDPAGGLFKTGLTETNVMDLRVFLFV